jgi:hypothetical protein
MIKIYLDEDVHKKAAYALRLKGFDVLHVSEANNNGLTDIEQLEYAISLKRTIFTFNVRDFIILHKKYLDDNKHHYGIIISPQINLSMLIKKLSLKILSLKPEEIYNQIYWL